MVLFLRGLARPRFLTSTCMMPNVPASSADIRVGPGNQPVFSGFVVFSLRFLCRTRIRSPSSKLMTTSISGS